MRCLTSLFIPNNNQVSVCFGIAAAGRNVGNCLAYLSNLVFLRDVVTSLSPMKIIDNRWYSSRRSSQRVCFYKGANIPLRLVKLRSLVSDLK